MSYNTLVGNMAGLQEANLIGIRIMLPNQRFIVWLASQDRLLTKERLQKLQMLVNNATCCLCEEELTETQTHSFVECTWITEVRGKLSAWSGFQFQKHGVRQSIRWIKRRH